MRRQLTWLAALLLPLPAAILFNRLVSPFGQQSAWLHNQLPLALGLLLGVACLLYLPGSWRQRAVRATLYLLAYAALAFGWLLVL